MAFDRSSSLVSSFSSEFDELKCPLKHHSGHIRILGGVPTQVGVWPELGGVRGPDSGVVRPTCSRHCPAPVRYGISSFHRLEMDFVESRTRNDFAFLRIWRRASPSNRISIGGMAYSGGSGGNSDGDGSVKASVDKKLFWNMDLLEILALSGWQYPTPDIGVLSEGGTKNFVIWDKDEADHERLQAGKFRPGSILHRQESRNPPLYFPPSCT